MTSLTMHIKVKDRDPDQVVMINRTDFNPTIHTEVEAPDAGNVHVGETGNVHESKIETDRARRSK